MAKNYRAELVGVFGDPVDDNPTGVMEEAGFRAKGLNYRYITAKVLPEALGAAIAGARALHMKGFNLTMPHKVRVIPFLDGMSEAARIIGDTYGCAVLVKGGHGVHDADDLLWQDSAYTWFAGRRIANPNTHGTGCTLSSAIAANLAKGFPLGEAVRRGKTYVSGALAAMLDLGKGSGPMDHAFALRGEFAEQAE